MKKDIIESCFDCSKRGETQDGVIYCSVSMREIAFNGPIPDDCPLPDAVVAVDLEVAA